MHHVDGLQLTARIGAPTPPFSYVVAFIPQKVCDIVQSLLQCLNTLCLCVCMCVCMCVHAFLLQHMRMASGV